MYYPLYVSLFVSESEEEDEEEEEEDEDESGTHTFEGANKR